MPHYAFCCRTCGLEFEVSRSMSDAGRDAACPVDGGVADRLFTAPMTSVRQGDGRGFRSGRERESRLVVAVLSESRSERRGAPASAAAPARPAGGIVEADPVPALRALAPRGHRTSRAPAQAAGGGEAGAAAAEG